MAPSKKCKPAATRARAHVQSARGFAEQRLCVQGAMPHPLVRSLHKRRTICRTRWINIENTRQAWLPSPATWLARRSCLLL